MKVRCSTAEKYSEPCQASKMEFFAKKVNGFQTLTSFAEAPSYQNDYHLLLTFKNDFSLSMLNEY